MLGRWICQLGGEKHFRAGLSFFMPLLHDHNGCAVPLLVGYVAWPHPQIPSLGDPLPPGTGSKLVSSKVLGRKEW